MLGTDDHHGVSCKAKGWTAQYETGFLSISINRRSFRQERNEPVASFGVCPINNSGKDSSRTQYCSLRPDRRDLLKYIVRCIAGDKCWSKYKYEDVGAFRRGHSNWCTVEPSMSPKDDISKKIMHGGSSCADTPLNEQTHEKRSKERNPSSQPVCVLWMQRGRRWTYSRNCARKIDRGT
jgi:hypothetical protein